MDIYFSDHFKVKEDILEKYGAFNVSLLFDLPLFIDPFLLFNSSKIKYIELHNDIIDYLRFLRDKSLSGSLPEGLIDAWFRFPEVKQNWFGYSKTSNEGRGLGRGFANSLNNNLNLVFSNFGNEKITKGSHLEKLYILNKGIGKDRISDFTTNLIKKFLLEYTEKFSIDNIHKSHLKTFNVSKVKFNYDTESWMPENFTLPYYKNNFVLLTPKDILTKDDTWINNADLLNEFDDIIQSISNDQLRAQINNYFEKILPKKPSSKDKNEAKFKTLSQYKQLIDYYIKFKEDNGDEAVDLSRKKVFYTKEVFVKNTKAIIEYIFAKTNFYELNFTTLEETRKRIIFFKDIIENKDGYKIFYYNHNPIVREVDVQLLFRFVWYASPSDVSRETNSGRGPVDYKISIGSSDKTLIEFKLAKSTSLKKNLLNQIEIYKKANDTDNAFCIILFFNEDELARVNKILKELELEQNEFIILIDASPKESASKAYNKK